MQQIYPAVWMALKKDVQFHLIKIFGIVRTGVSEIRDQTVVSDGFTVEDLMKISHEKMTEYIGSEETFMRSWEITLAKVHAELNPPVAIIQNMNGEPTAVDIVESTQVIDSDSVPIAMIQDKSSITFSPEPIKPAWCNSCDSKGVRHKLGCPHYTPTK